MGLFGGNAPEKIRERMGVDELPPASSQPSALMANVYHLVESDEPGIQYAISGDQWRAYQTERGVCWACGDVLPAGARFCISCRAEMPPAMGETERLYVPPALGKTERL